MKRPSVEKGPRMESFGSLCASKSSKDPGFSSSKKENGKQIPNAGSIRKSQGKRKGLKKVSLIVGDGRGIRLPSERPPATSKGRELAKGRFRVIRRPTGGVEPGNPGCFPGKQTLLTGITDSQAGRSNSLEKPPRGALTEIQTGVFFGPKKV